MKETVRYARHNSFPLWRCACLITSLILYLSGCVPQSTNVPPIQDDLGRTIQLGGTPHKVVSLAPSVTELIYASGAGDRLVGVTTVDDYPPDVQTLSSFSALKLGTCTVIPFLMFAIVTFPTWAGATVQIVC